MRIIFQIAMMLLVANLWSCSGDKLSLAERQMSAGQYHEAAKSYHQIYNNLKGKESQNLKGEIAYKLAEAHKHLSQWGQASVAYQNALRYNYQDSASARLGLAQMQQAEGKYSLAEKNYAQYLKYNPESVKALKGLESVRFAIKSVSHPTRYKVGKLKDFNTMRSEFSPMLQDDQMYFTTTNEKVTGDMRSGITGMKMSDIWVARKDQNGRWMKAEPIAGEVNTEMDEGICSFSPDGSVMYLTRSNHNAGSDTSVEIYVSRRSNAQWDEPEKLNINIDSTRSYGHPAVSPGGDYLYFSADMNGMGGKDIWRVNLNRLEDRPVNLGPEINTDGNEMYPYMLTDSIMYFASDGHPGLGGLDLYKAVLTPDGHWIVSNMGTPINSPADDFGITFERDNAVEQGYFSSNREDRRGYDNIYSFVLPEENVSISGWVTDHDYEPIRGATIRIVGDNGSLQRTASGQNGDFKFKLTRGVSYVMMANAENYLNGRQEFTTDSTDTDASYEIEFMLAAINRPNIIENIFYDFDKATLRPESKTALDALVKMLYENPNVTIEMSSHTDRSGSEEYNAALSQRRAKSVVDYLIEAGISPQRLKYNGYGKTKPKTVTNHDVELYHYFKEGDVLTEDFINSLPDQAAKDAADQINRRTEFKVLSVDYNLN